MKFETFLLLTMNDFSVKHRLFLVYVMSFSFLHDPSNRIMEGCCRTDVETQGLHLASTSGREGHLVTLLSTRLNRFCGMVVKIMTLSCDPSPVLAYCLLLMGSRVPTWSTWTLWGGGCLVSSWWE
jgi:hypothetical protein